MKLPTSVRAVVTGGASGLGRALCRELAPRNARILIADLDLDGANATAEDVRRAGGSAEIMRCDVATLADVEALGERVDSLWGGVDLVVNNAGVAVAGKVGDVSMDDWRWITAINQWGVVHGCHVFVPRMRAQGRGWLLNVASSAGFASLPEMAPYNVTKAAVIALSETLYAELAPHNISVSVACPTFFKTRLMDTFRSSEPRQREFAQKLFDRSTMTAEQVAKACVRGLERDRLHVVPQADGRLVSLAKRIAPRTYHRLLRRQQLHNLTRHL